MTRTKKSSKVVYKKYGNKEKALLLFHGYGQNLEDTVPPLLFLEEYYTLYFIEWKETTLDALLDFIKQLPTNSLNIWGYSIGARWVLSILSKTNIVIDQVYLVAPDGIKTHFLFYLSTKTSTGKSLFAWLCKHPKKLQRLLKVASLIPSLKKPALYAQRLDLSLLYQTWTQCASLEISKKNIKKIIGESPTKFYIWIGSKDVIIASKPIKQFCLKNPKVNLKELPIGHYQLLRKFQTYYQP